MKSRTKALSIYLIGCSLLGGASQMIWGIKGGFFAIALIIITHPAIQKVMVSRW